MRPNRIPNFKGDLPKNLGDLNCNKIWCLAPTEHMEQRNQIWYKTIPSRLYVQILIQFMYVLPCSTISFCICDLMFGSRTGKKARCVLSCDIIVWELVAVSSQITG